MKLISNQSHLATIVFSKGCYNSHTIEKLFEESLKINLELEQKWELAIYGEQTNCIEQPSWLWLAQLKPNLIQNKMQTTVSKSLTKTTKLMTELLNSTSIIFQ